MSGGRRPSAIIFGAGSGGEVACQRLRREYNVVAFADNDVGKQGLRLRGLPVIAPEAIVDADVDVVLIASLYGFEIYDQLRGLGISPGRIEIADVAGLVGEAEERRGCLIASYVGVALLATVAAALYLLFAD